MLIRWKLLILLLAIALIPLGVVTLLTNRATYRLGTFLGERTSDALVEATKQQLQEIVSDKAALILREGMLISLAVQFQAREVERCLAAESPPPREVFFATDWEACQEVPADLALSAHHTRVDANGQVVPIAISESEVSFHLPPGVNPESVTTDMQRLAMMAPVYGAIRRNHEDLFYWQFTSLESGLHSIYPGHGGYPEDYDPRQRRWYIRARQSSRVVWTLPYLDASSRRAVLAAAMPVYDPDGRFAGATAINVTVADLLKGARPPRFNSSLTKIVSLDLRGDWDMNVPREIDVQEYEPKDLGMLIVAEPADVQKEGGWESPADRRWLEPDDPAETLEILDDMRAGRSAVRRVSFKGQPHLWAYARMWERGGYLVTLVPYEQVVADAVRAKEGVLSLTLAHLRLTLMVVAVVSLVVFFVAFSGSRTVTRPIRQLAAAAQRIASGDLDARVHIRTHDEIGALGRTFNEMVPQLQDRMRIRQSLSLAMEVQQNLLPTSAPQVQGLDVAGRSIYCDETGGDYYDFLDLSELSPHQLGVAVGDVTGHGVAAALLMTTARALLRSQADQPHTLSALMCRINRLLSGDTPPGRFMTLFYAVLDTQRRSVAWVSAGHDPAILYNPAKDRFHELDGADLPLGIEADEPYRQFEYSPLDSGEIIVIGTDGIWETRNQDARQFGKEALNRVIRENASLTAGGIARAITAAIDDYRGECAREDDVTLVVVKIGKLDSPGIA